MIDTFRKIWKFSKNRHKPLVLGLIFSFIKSIFGITEILSIIYTIEVMLSLREANNGMIIVIILTLICVLGNFIISYFEQLNTLKAGFFMMGDKRVEIANTLRNVPLAYFKEISKGDITSTLTTTIASMESAIAMVMVGIVSGIFNAIAFTIFMLFYNYIIGLISLLGMILYLIVIYFQMKNNAKCGKAVERSQSTLTKETLNFLKGIKVIKSFDYEAADSKVNEAIDESMKANLSLTNVTMPLQLLGSLLIAIFESIILVVSLSLYQNNEITKTIVLLIFSFMIFAPLNQAGSMLSMIGVLDEGLSKVDELANIKTLMIDEPKACPKSNDIVLENVSFSYGEKEILHDISLTFKEHTFNAIVGPSGSGKTTLCQLIARYMDIDKGLIKLGDINIKNIPYDKLMDKFAFVFQDVYLFEDTVLNNIRFSKPSATIEEVRMAAKKAQCDDFIMNLENGYDTLVLEGGGSLSGGEKQRISIARAILKDSPIIILDEATASIDIENEYALNKAIQALTKDKTVIMIAHKLETIKKADQIIVLKDGSIEEIGTHDTLKNKKGTYKEFIAIRKKATNWQL